MVIIKCTNCKKDKPESDFSVRSGKRNKQCKKCREYHNTLWKENHLKYRDKRKEYYRNNKERHTLRNFKNSILKKYNLTVERYNEMLTIQNNQCAICRADFNKNLKPCVDHCHRTNMVRGLLCRKCNLSLHYIEFKFIEQAQEYLRVNEVENKESLR
jgi:hypothetical protein